MEILKRKIVCDRMSVRNELLYLDCGFTILVNCTLNNGTAYASIYHVTGFNEVGDYTINNDGMKIGEVKSNSITSAYLSLIDSFYNKMQDDERYRRTIQALCHD